MSEAQLSGLFFKPVQIHGQLPDLLMQRRDQFLLVLRLLATGLKQVRQPFPDRGLPLAHLNRVDAVLPGDLRDGLDPPISASKPTLALKAALCRFRFAFIGLLFLICRRPRKV